ncbi:MAG: MmgE/PrpD family protein, partial [Chloroflexota bacterium]|nr:MmgE/PrpD family protein [Chloroflexota bacterium]
MGTTERLACFLVETGYNNLPQEVVRVAKRAFLDGMGVALAGSQEEAGRIIAHHVKEQGGAKECRVLGNRWRVPAPAAALANGIMAHALDYDDYAPGWVAHPTAAILPAVLALGERGHISGKEALEAYVLGFEVGARAGYGAGRRHYEAGFHSTATLGTLGAAAASAKLLRLSIPETRMALGIAASEAAGLRQNFGSMTKPFHAGNAARGGVTAALLAQQGFTASEDILDGPQGFVHVLAGEGHFEKMLDGLGETFDILSPGLEMKPYPCCRGTHRCLDAMFALLKERPFSPDEVEAVECRTSDIVPQ